MKNEPTPYLTLEPVKTAEKGRFRTIEIKLGKGSLEQYSWAQRLWGTDIWINGWPVLKLLALAQILFWIAVVVSLKLLT